MSTIEVDSNRKAPIVWKDAVAGALSGALARTALAPVERVKLLKQLQGSVPFAQNCSAWEVARNIYVEQGFLAFWRGNWPNVLRVAGNSALNFTLMDYYKQVAVSSFLESQVIHKTSSISNAQIQRKRKVATSFVSGGCAGATSTTLLYPFEFLRTRLAMDVGTNVQNRTWNGLGHIVRNIMRVDGLRGFYQGYGIALTGGILYRLLFLGGYDALKSELALAQHQENLTWPQRFMCAQIISLASGTVCYPFDSIRRRMMMQAGVPHSERRYVSSIDCMSKTWRLEGVRGFYLGIGPNLLRSVSGALLLVSYDTFKILLK